MECMSHSRMSSKLLTQNHFFQQVNLEELVSIWPSFSKTQFFTNSFSILYSFNKIFFPIDNFSRPFNHKIYYQKIYIEQTLNIFLQISCLFNFWYNNILVVLKFNWEINFILLLFSFIFPFLWGCLESHD